MTTIAKDINGQPLQAVGLGATQKLAIGGSSVQSTAATAAARLVRLVATVDCHVAIGENPTATTDSALLPASAAEYFEILAGQKVAVIQSGEAGYLFVTEGK